MNLLEQARQQVSFDVDSVTPLLYGSKEQAEYIKQFLEKCKTIPEVQTSPDYYNWNRGIQFLSKGDQALAFQKLLDFRLDEIPLYLGTIIYSATTNYYGVYYGMVVPAIKVLGTDEQINAWYKDCLNLKIAGCYAQTELAHGSDVQSLQTTATYDQNTDEFIIHTPTVEAVKFWPGELGFLANWALVYAKLIVNNKSHGVQAFMVPIRDLNTHKPLPGIEVGDIGPKIGYTSKDNGYLKFTHCRIPRFNMLAKYIKVTRDGQVIRQGDPKVSYSAMMIMRKLIITVYPRTAATSLTIAIRYSIARQQFTNDQGQENSVLEYQTQQHKLLPLLANLYSIIFTGLKVGQLVDLNFNQVQKGDFSLMAICHAIICGTKANFTYFVSNCAEWCRLSCGGHGYAHYSGLPAIYQDNCPNITLEGENQIMYLQLARYLLKIYNQAKQASKKINETYFGLFNRLQSILDYRCTQFTREQILQLLESNVIHSIQFTNDKMMSHIQNGLDPKSVWDYKVGTDLWNSANNFIEYYKYLSFLQTIDQADNINTKRVLRDLADLFAASILLDGSNVLIETGVINVESIKLIREFYVQQLALIKPEAIGLVEAFRYNDASLRSTIGCSDGQPYEKTYYSAINDNSLNKTDFKPIINQLKNIKARL
ncbi:unnamed protein product [Paramecium pentaurelia]|uniref:Acyl-coenzyme A oxidase n=1 Tax=Paramecium pentaurelia TaxID=43138 RepID=A0A8S1TUG5_9CILI|nr:unnamed protein product [Paramecium pentaurelia]